MAFYKQIGEKVRQIRLVQGLTQRDLAGILGVTFQQVQKYEKGTNRISAGALYEIAERLGVPVTYFYEGLNEVKMRNPEPVRREEVETLRYYNKISSTEIRKSVRILLQTLAKQERAEAES